MVYLMHQATQSTLDALHADPELIIRFLGGPVPAAAPRRPGFFARLFGAPVPSRSTPPTPSFQFPSGLEVCGLDKAWHGLHYLLSGSDWEGDGPEAFLLNGGTEIGEVDVGYGPARSFTPDEIVQIHDCLSRIAPETLRVRFDPAKMTELELYPNVWDRDPEAELESLLNSYEDLRQFVERTADSRLGLVVYLG